MLFFLEMLRTFKEFSIAFGGQSSSVLGKHEERSSTRYHSDRHAFEVMQVVPDGVNNSVESSCDQESLVTFIYC